MAFRELVNTFFRSVDKLFLGNEDEVKKLAANLKVKRLIRERIQANFEKAAKYLNLLAGKMTKLLKILGVVLLFSQFAMGQETRSSAYFTKIEPYPTTVGLGYILNNHRLGILGSRVSGEVAYSSAGLEYAYHLTQAFDDGAYLKTFYEYRWFDSGLEVNSRHSEDSEEWEHDTLDHHVAHHIGALLGYQWILGLPEIFLQAGIGWQYNSNPVDIGPTYFGINQSVKSRSEATGELAIGYLF